MIINLNRWAFMKMIKFIPFYLFMALNSFIVFVYLTEYPKDMISDQMPWNAEALGGKYENRLNYSIVILIDLIILIAPSVYAWRNLRINTKKAYIAVSIPFFVYLIKFVCYQYF